MTDDPMIDSTLIPEDVRRRVKEAALEAARVVLDDAGMSLVDAVLGEYYDRLDEDLAPVH